MREVIYRFNSRGFYETDGNISFGEESQIKIIAEPHNFSIAVGDEVLRSSFFGGCSAVVSCDGAVVFYDNENNIAGKADKSDTCYKKVKFVMEKDSVAIIFGYEAEVDYYPNCDGEYDRWGWEWVTQRTVKLMLNDNSVEIK